MLLKEDFQRQIRDSISLYPDAALLYRAGDPRLLAQLDAIAAMFGMLSQQFELASAEAFTKSRDATVLADAALKGLLPMAIPARQTITVTNGNAAPYTVAAGRRLFDSSGALWVVDTPVTLAAGATGTCTAIQRTTRDIAATIAIGQPFATIEIPPSEDASLFIAGIAVKRASDNQPFTYKPRFVNTDPGDLVYTVETDEYRRLYVRFGSQDVVGYQPGTGEAFTITVSECAGDVRPDANSPMTFEYTLAPADQNVTMKATALLTPGTAPVDIATLRELTKYPSVYDDNAVFMGEFDRLVRKAIPDIKFLSIWNEQIEEQARGASVNNINVLFVSMVPPTGSVPSEVEDQIEDAIAEADDSYEVRFVAPVVRKIDINIDAYVSIVNDPVAVEAQILAKVLELYGADTPAARSGMLVPQHKAIYDLLRRDVPALKDQPADLRIEIVENVAPLLPEHRQYADAGSVVINVIPLRENIGNWGR